MYSASQREVGEYSDRMRLEVGTKLFSSYLKCQCHLLEMGILGFCLGQVIRAIVGVPESTIFIS